MGIPYSFLIKLSTSLMGMLSYNFVSQVSTNLMCSLYRLEHGANGKNLKKARQRNFIFFLTNNIEPEAQVLIREPECEK
ncbi:hypothetical protein KSP40_PGU006382 [Platanthera guangdongensis]|uniref:Uncharacterized protein n=1 Tax=Platanthera guangdongensis TaxID=2320717 RepID=A0ABR2LZS8_9ASPA